MAGCGAWAAWRMWFERPAVYVGRVEAAALVGVVLLFVGVMWAPYRRAALLASWEWVGLLLVLFLARQLAAQERERHGLYAALLATGVALGVQALYQGAWELPRARAEVARQTEEGKLRGGAREYVLDQFRQSLEVPDAAELELLVQRLQRNAPSASYLYPASLAAVLVLLVPGLIAAAGVAVRGGAELWQIVVAWACALIGFTALLLTGAWLTMLAALLAGLLVLARGNAVRSLGAVAVVAALAAGLYAIGALTPALRERGEAVAGSWRLIRDGNHVWTGVGPGQFSFFYPRYMSETDGAPPISAGSGLLDLWAEGGLLVMLSFVVAAGLFAVAVWRWWARTPPAERDQPAPPGPDVPWEFYLGGMFGVLFAFVLRISSLSETDVLTLALLAALGSLAWFAAYALFEQVVWTPAERVLALTAGVAALGLALLVGPGTLQPAVVAFLFVAAGLLLAHVEPTPSAVLSRGTLATGVPVPVFVAGAFGFFLLVVVPAANTAAATRRSQKAGVVLLDQISRDERSIRDPAAALRERVVRPLEVADREEPGVVRTNLHLASWYATLWRLSPLQQGPYTDHNRAQAHAAHARSLCAVRVGKDRIDPVGTEALLTEYDMLWRFRERMLSLADRWEERAKDPKAKPAEKQEYQRGIASFRQKAEEAARFAAVPLERAIKEDPTSPRLWFLLAEVWDAAGDKEKRQEAAGEATRLTARVGAPRRLTGQQGDRLDEWMAVETPK